MWIVDLVIMHLAFYQQKSYNSVFIPCNTLGKGYYGFVHFAMRL